MSVSAVYLLAVTQDSPVFLMSTCVSQAQLSRKYKLDFVSTVAQAGSAWTHCSGTLTCFHVQPSKQN